MPVLPQAFFPLVGCHFMSLTLLSAWHCVVTLWDDLLYTGFNLTNKGLRRLK